MYIPSIHYVTVTYIALHAHYKRFKKKKRMDLLYTCTRVCIRTQDKRVRVRMHGRARRDTYTYEYIYNNYIAIPKRTTATSTYEDHLKLLQNTNAIGEMENKKTKKIMEVGEKEI